MASPLTELLIVIGIDPEKAEKAVESLQEKVHEGFKEMGKHVLEFLGVVGSVSEFVSFMENTIQSQVAIQRLSQEAHVGAEEISTMQIAAEKYGGSAEGVNASITSLGEKLSVVGTKMRGARMSGMALGMAMGYQGKQAEEMGAKIFKGKGPMESMQILAEKMHGMDFFKAKKLGAMVGITDEGQIRMLTKTKDEYDAAMEHAKKFAATQEETESSEKFEEAQKDMAAALHKVGMVIVEHVLPLLQIFMDKLVTLSDIMVDHPKVIKTIVVALGLVGVSFMVAAANASISWLKINLAGATNSVHIIAQLIGVEEAADKSGVAFVRNAVKAVWGWTTHAATAVAHAAVVVWAWITTAATATWAGIQTAKAWIIGLGPIAWIIAGIAAVIAIIVALELKFHIFEAAWGWIKTAAKNSLDWVVDRLKAVGALVMDYLSIWGKFLTGDFKGAIKSAINVVHDFGNITGSGPTPAHAMAGNAVNAGASIAPSVRHSISSSSHKVDSSRHIHIDKVEVQTQATDAKGVAAGVGGALENVVNQHDGAF